MGFVNYNQIFNTATKPVATALNPAATGAPVAGTATDTGYSSPAPVGPTVGSPVDTLGASGTGPSPYDNIDMSGANNAATAAGNTAAQNSYNNPDSVNTTPGSAYSTANTGTFGNTNISPSLEDLWQSNGGLYGQSHNTQDLYNSAAGQAGQPTSSQSAYNDVTKGAYGTLAGQTQGQTETGAYSGQVGNQYLQPGALEQFAASDLAGNNPYYERIGQQGRAAIDQASAARGAYGSGGALAALGNYQSGLDAQQYQQEGQLQNNAQQAWQNRLTAGGNLAGQAFNERNTQNNTELSRLAGLTTGASTADTSSNNRLTTLGNLGATADSNYLANLNGQFNTAGNVQGSEQTRLNSMLDQLFKGNLAESNLTSGFYTTGGETSGSAMDSSINAGAHASGLQGKADNAAGATANNALLAYLAKK